MRIIITEEQKKKLFIPLTESEQSKKGKLFIPRRIDERNEKLKGEIKKFLNSIKDSFIWDFIGNISVSYNFESGYEDISYMDINGKWLDMRRFGKYGEENAKEMTIEFNKISDKIQDFINGLLDSEGYIVVYAWGEIINHGNGKLEYKEHRTRKIEQMDYMVVSL